MPCATVLFFYFSSKIACLIQKLSINNMNFPTIPKLIDKYIKNMVQLVKLNDKVLIKRRIEVMSGIFLYVTIFIGQFIITGLSTLRIMLVNRGQRLKGACMHIFEATLWVIVISMVITNISEDPFKVVTYVLACATGTYMGGFIEKKLAFGNCTMQIIASENVEKGIMAEALRNRGFAVTTITGQGRNGEREILMLYIHRRQYATVNEIIQNTDKNAVITILDISSIKNAHFK